MSDTDDVEDSSGQNKVGRPRKDPSERRSQTYALRLSPNEREELEKRADRAGISLAEYIRRRALGKVVKSSVDEEAIREIKRVGVNLNQLVRRAHQDGASRVKEEALSVIDELKEAIQSIDS